MWMTEHQGNEKPYREYFRKNFLVIKIISPMPLFDLLFADDIQLLIKIKKNMKQPNVYNNRILLGKRAIIESVNDELKNICKLQPTWPRSINGFLFNIMSTLAAYSFFPKKAFSKYQNETV